MDTQKDNGEKREIPTEQKEPQEEKPVTPAAEPKKRKKKAKSGKKTAKWKKIVGGIFTAVIVLILAFFAFVLIMNRATNKPYLFGYATYTIISGSMEPELEIGDVILVKKVNSIKDLKVGDTITYSGKKGNLAGKTVTHRIIRIEGEKIVTRGISKEVTSEDPAIEFQDVIGKYVKTSAFLTVTYSLFLNKYGFLCIIFVPLLVLLVIQVVNFRRACKMDKDGNMPGEKTEEEIKEAAIKEKEDEIKRKAIEDYLASKKRIEKAGQKKRNDK